MRRRPTLPFTGRLIVRLKPGATAALLQRMDSEGEFPATLPAIASAIGPNATPLVSLLSHPGMAVQPAVPPALAAAVRQKEEGVRVTGLAPIRSLLSYYLVDARAATGAPIDLFSQLAELAVVDFVQREPTVEEADWVVDPNDFSAGSGTERHGLHALGYEVVPEWGEYYGLNCANDAVWGKYSGAGVGFIDLEAGWHLTHADLPAATGQQPLHNFNCTRDNGAHRHGTNSLGVVIGVDDDKGVVGIAPNAIFRGVVSRATVDTDDVLRPDVIAKCADITGAIAAAVEHLQPGDVLLVEVHTRAGMHPTDAAVPNYAPIEIVDLWFDALRYASGYGVVVIEPAGNGTYDLDNPGWTWDMGGRSLNRNDPAFQDSGVIMVSACSPKVNDAITFEHDLELGVNYGSRIDCFGWSTQVGTTDITNGADTYYGSFSATSAASAMVAGAALLVQEMCRAVGGTSASPPQIRLLLSESGTPVVGTGKVVPDLAMVAARVGALADVFVRDSVADDGTVPSANVSMSPDIIIRSAPDGDPQGTFGDGSGVEDTFLDNDPIAPDKPNYIYVRVRNRSTIAAAAVRATVYWADTMFSVPPSEWSEIDVTDALPVPAAPAMGVPGPVTVLGPITWSPVSGAKPPQYPAQHGCLVAVIDSVDDPRPAVFPSFADLDTGWTAFINTVGANNNIAYRNFDVLTLAPAPNGLQAQAEVIIPGAPMPAAFDILIRVPECPDVKWEIVLPKAIAQAFRNAEFTEHAPDGFLRMKLVPGGSYRARNVMLGSRARHRCRVLVLARREPDKPCFLRMSQEYRGIEIGQLTLAVGPRPPREERALRDDRL